MLSFGNCSRVCRHQSTSQSSITVSFFKLLHVLIFFLNTASDLLLFVFVSLFAWGRSGGKRKRKKKTGGGGGGGGDVELFAVGEGHKSCSFSSTVGFMLSP